MTDNQSIDNSMGAYFAALVGTFVVAFVGQAFFGAEPETTGDVDWEMFTYIFIGLAVFQRHMWHLALFGVFVIGGCAGLWWVLETFGN